MLYNFVVIPTFKYHYHKIECMELHLPSDNFPYKLVMHIEQYGWSAQTVKQFGERTLLTFFKEKQ